MGTIHVIECFVPPMIRARRGHVVNIASVAGLIGLPWHGGYSTSKWAVVGLSEVLRYDLRQHGIGVTVVCPGAVDTPLQHSAPILGVPPDRPALLDFRAALRPPRDGARDACAPDLPTRSSATAFCCCRRGTSARSTSSSATCRASII